MARRETHDWFFEIGADLARLSEELSQGRIKIAHGPLWEPKIDVLEDDDKIIVRAEIAGVRGDAIRLIYIPERNSLLIKGMRREQPRSESVAAHQLEIYYGDFEREQQLPSVVVSPEGIEAQYRNGFLTVVIPKA